MSQRAGHGLAPPLGGLRSKPPAPGIVDGVVHNGHPPSVAGLPFCSPSPSGTNIGQRLPTRLWQSAIGWGGVAVGRFATVTTGVVPGGG